MKTKQNKNQITREKEKQTKEGKKILIPHGVMCSGYDNEFV